MIKEFCNLIRWEIQLATPYQKVIALGANFLWWLYSCKKSNRSIDSLQWWSENTVIWLPQRILGHDWRNRYFVDTQFLQIRKEYCYASFSGKKTHKWIKFFVKAKKPYLARIFGFLPKMRFSLKFALQSSTFMKHFQKILQAVSGKKLIPDLLTYWPTERGSFIKPSLPRVQ